MSIMRGHISAFRFSTTNARCAEVQLAGVKLTLRAVMPGGRIVTQRINSAMRTYSYDLTDQLTNSTGASSYSATYDAVGNRLTADGGAYTPANSINQYPYISTSGTLSYDANGNLIQTPRLSKSGKRTR